MLTMGTLAKENTFIIFTMRIVLKATKTVKMVLLLQKENVNKRKVLFITILHSDIYYNPIQ